VLTPAGLEPLDLLDPNMHRRKLGFQARLAWFPDELEDASVGLLFAHNELAWRGPRSPLNESFDHVDQTVVGLYANLGAGNWKMQGAAYRIESDLGENGGSATRNNFVAGYVQIERSLPRGLEVFLRHEDSADTEQAGYLRLFPNFVTWRTSIGARWQFAREHALSIQVGDSHTMFDRYREFRLQWSAALL
jgi:hypothetical protein